MKTILLKWDKFGIKDENNENIEIIFEIIIEKEEYENFRLREIIDNFIEDLQKLGFKIIKTFK